MKFALFENATSHSISHSQQDQVIYMDILLGLAGND